MKKSTIRVISIILIACMILTCVISLTGCGNATKDYEDMNKKELLECVYSLQNQRDSLLAENQSMKSTLSALSDSNSTLPAISVVGDGSGNKTFNSYDSKIIFPESFKYPNSKEISAVSSISIVPSITVSPNSNWITKLNAASLELEHSSGISGIIKVGQVDAMYTKDMLKPDVLEPWFSNITSSTVQYSNIFIQNINWGTQAQTSILIDEEPAYLKCGMIGFANYTVTYVFVYRGQQDSNKDESVNALVNSMVLLGQKINVD